MTKEQALEILKTYKLPLTNEQLAQYREALCLIACSSMKVDINE